MKHPAWKTQVNEVACSVKYEQPSCTRRPFGIRPAGGTGLEVIALLDISVFEALQQELGLKLVNENRPIPAIDGSCGREADRIASEEFFRLGGAAAHNIARR